jgi:hypothetical protein
MSIAPGPRARPGPSALEPLERAVSLEHRVDVADEQHLGPAAGPLGDEVPGAAEGGAVDPAGGEAEGCQLRRHEVGDRADAGEVHRAAVDVDQPFEQRHRRGLAGVDRRHDGLLGRGEWPARRALRRHGGRTGPNGGEQPGQCGDGPTEVAARLGWATAVVAHGASLA